MPARKAVTGRVGHPAGLQFEFSFGRKASRAAEGAFGWLSAWISDDLVWGRLDAQGGTVGVEWYWVALLEHLATHWRYLRLEQGYPFGLMPLQPSGLDLELQRRWWQPEIDESAEGPVVYGYRSTHNLALALDGCVVPDLWFVREGNIAILEAKGRAWRCPHARELNTLEQFGDVLYRQVSGSEEQRAADARSAWERRNEVSFEESARIFSGSTEESLSELTSGMPYEHLFSDPLAASVEDNRAIDLVYRCKGRLPPAALRGLLEQFPRDLGRYCRALETLSRRARKELEDMASANIPPHAQGRKLALMLRRDADLFPQRCGRADPEELLRDLGVTVHRWRFDSGRLDAVAVWGHERTPWIVVNRHEKHESNPGAERATVAHELCHLLVDRDDVLPLTAAVGGVMDRAAEQRANAFAAEFLCPRFCLHQMFDQFMSADVVIDRATQQYGVSRELAALQLARAECQLSTSDQRQIEAHVSPYASLPWRSP